MNRTTPETSSRLKALVIATPLLGPAARTIARIPIIKELRHSLRFQGSSSYWKQRYQEGGSSGPGSAGKLAQFKAEVLNEFVARNRVQSVIEFGCGDGVQLGLARYPRYVGVDVAEGSVINCRRKFASDSTKSFYLADQIPSNLGQFDLVLSLDVIFHLVETRVFEAYMRSLFVNAGRFVVIYSSNKASVGEAPHVRHRQFTRWIETHQPEWQMTAHIPNRYPFDPAHPDDTSFADFYFFERRG
jgi:cyclopropane fatty-acyl-phospholipid synthase-like methyltransferase